MPVWNDGYVTDVVYTSNFYREMTPAWLAATCLLLGQRPPDLTRPFRYADLGCGHGFTALVVAAAYPDAEVWGFDFNPAHVEWATRMAAAAELTNVRFVDASFAELAARPEAALPAFDIMVSHGVLSWISPENRRAMLDVVRQRLRPGGLAYVSYNVITGWAAMVPLRRLMHMMEQASPARTDLAVAGILDFMDRMKQAGAVYFQANPRVESRLEDMRKQDPRYIAHEFLNRDWHPLMFADIAEAMADSKCAYVGSASLSENVDALAAPPGMMPVLAEVQGQVLRETVRDFASGQAFRRDVYRRGLAPLSGSEQNAMLDAMTFAPLILGMPDPLNFPSPIGTVTGRPEIYRPLFELLAEDNLSVRQARESPYYADHPLGELLQAFTLMTAGGYVHPLLPTGATAAARAAGLRLNRAIAAENGHGADLPRLAAPAIGSALQVDLLETLLIDDLLAGRPADPASLTASVLSGLERSGRTMQRDGKPVTDPADAKLLAGDVVQRFLERRMPVLRRLGIL
jgi:SAM-dependent methyltransferase